MLNPNYALQKELENELNWLRTAKMEQIQNKIYAADNQKINDIKKENYAFELPKPPNYLINDNNSGDTPNGNNYNNFSKRNQDGLILI